MRTRFRTGPNPAPLAHAALLACALAAAAPGAAASDDLSLLEQLVTLEVQSVSKYPQSTLDAPARVTVIRREEIAAKGYTTLADVLQAVPGVYTTSDRGATAIGVRGLNRPGDYNVRTLMLIDGYRANDVVFDQVMVEYDQPVLAQWIKRLEFIAGPSSSIYGGNALFGTANLVMLDGADAPGLKVEATSASFGTRRIVGQYGTVLSGGQDVFVGIAAYGSDGETLYLPSYGSPDNPSGRVAGLEDARYAALYSKYKDGPWRVTLAGSRRTKGQATAPYETEFGVDGTEYIDTTVFVDGLWDPGASGSWHPQARVSLSHYRYDGHYAYAEAVKNVDRLEGDWLNAEYRATWRGRPNHTVVLGVEGRKVLHARLRNYDVDPPASYLDHTSRGGSAGVFVQDQYRLAERWTLTSGLRLDTVNGGGAEWSPRAALVYRPAEGQALKLMGGRAFRSGNLNERYYEDGGVTQIPNPGLDREHVNTVELSWEQALDDRTRLAASLYRYQVDGMIEMEQLPEGVSQYRNQRSAHAEGLEVELEHARAGGLQVRGSAGLHDARSHGARLSNSPRWLVKGSLVAPLGPHFEGALEMRAMGLRLTREGKVPGYVVGNATLRYKLSTRHHALLRVTNLGDVRYDDPSTPALLDDRVRQPRRQIELTWQSRF
ncbi:TonB-dependent receptor plug domain-containing protein [Caldimonas brevitalea]|uniref:Iron complex outermembrane recepter protein n=1 Tax=Caldimonas brevitalea TaxID=413882 RepID=A0A0G3BC98_9BURK|nr:TonB-dependent receptor [Caldimonas brevitalea]AKJ26989.1 iron complex outermembrane recepter protein [Caldimonas brevitalea]